MSKYARLIGSVFGPEGNRPTLVLWTNEIGLGVNAHVKTNSTDSDEKHFHKTLAA